VHTFGLSPVFLPPFFLICFLSPHSLPLFFIFSFTLCPVSFLSFRPLSSFLEFFFFFGLTFSFFSPSLFTLQKSAHLSCTYFVKCPVQFSPSSDNSVSFLMNSMRPSSQLFYLFLYGLFNDDIINSAPTVSNCRLLGNTESERVYKEAVLA
jgi:hypothetical protein